MPPESASDSSRFAIITEAPCRSSSARYAAPADRCRGAGARRVYVGLVAFGALYTGVFLSGFFVEDPQGVGRAPVIGAFLVATAVATLGMWALQLMGRLDVHRLPLLRLAGYAMLVGTAITGAFRLVSDVREIL